jgi:mono/diheme cytochrome c family protein
MKRLLWLMGMLAVGVLLSTRTSSGSNPGTPTPPLPTNNPAYRGQLIFQQPTACGQAQCHGTPPDLNPQDFKWFLLGSEPDFLENEKTIQAGDQMANVLASLTPAQFLDVTAYISTLDTNPYVIKGVVTYSELQRRGVRSAARGLPGVTVTLAHTPFATLTTVTGPTGEYSFPSVHAGESVISATKAGYIIRTPVPNPIHTDVFTSQLGTTTTVDFTASPSVLPHLL